MTISSSLNAGVAGLNANATKLATISDNIANSSTYGYKRATADFHSQVISGNAGKYSAGGVRTTTQRLIDERGPLVSTSNPTDIAVSGRGMIPVTSSVSVSADSGTPPMFLMTTGSFRPDAEGVLTSESGMVLMGWPAGIDGNIPVFPRETSDGLAPVQVNLNQFASAPTTHMTLGVNLPATETNAGSAGDPRELSVEYFGNLGTSENLDISFVPNVPATGASNEWTLNITDGATGSLVGQYTLLFSDSRAEGGTLSSVTPVIGGAYDPVAGSVNINVAGGPMEIEIGELGDPGGMTQLSDSFAPISIDKNGSPVGNLTSVEIDQNGFVHAIYDIGFTRTIYQVPLVDVSNPNGLISLNNQAYQVSPESGDFFLWNAGEGPTGEVIAFSREESATDVAAELTQLIQTQRAYSSNAKVIQTVELSFALATFIPVEISFCVLARFELMPLSVCKATIALLLVRILDMVFPLICQRFCAVIIGLPIGQSLVILTVRKALALVAPPPRDARKTLRENT